MTARPLVGAAAAVLAAASLGAGSGPVESFWISPTGGAFDNAASWDGPVPDATVTAIFDILPAGAEIGVRFNQDETSHRLILRTTTVNLDLWDTLDGLQPHHYETLNLSILEPSIVVGQNPADVARLIIEGGSLAAAVVVLGEQAGSSGTVEFREHSGLVPSLSGDLLLIVGQAGAGTLDVPAGVGVDAGAVVVGAEFGASGLVTLEGPDAEIAATTTVTVGEQGQGTLVISDAAGVTSTGVFIGQQPGSEGTVTVTGAGSIWHVGGSMDVGQEGQGTLEILDGAAVVNEGFVTVGTFDTPGDPPITGVGHVTVSGPASLWLVDGDLWVPFHGIGTLEILDHAVVTSDAGFVGTTFGVMGGASLSGGGVWSVAGDLAVHGLLEVNDSAIVVADLVFVGTVGELAGDGTVRADLNLDGTISPGNPVGTLTIEGAADFGNLFIDLASGESFDAVVSTVSALVSGPLHVTLVDGFVPEAGDCFEIVSAPSVQGIFTTLDLPALPPPLFWDLAYPDDAVILRVGPIPGDLDGDGQVGTTDLLALLAAWGPCPGCPEDLDGDGSVGVGDLLLLLCQWG